MAANRKKELRSEARPTGPEADWRHLATAGGLVAAVLGTVALGALLKADEGRPVQDGVALAETRVAGTSDGAVAPHGAPHPALASPSPSSEADEPERPPVERDAVRRPEQNPATEAEIGAGSESDLARRVQRDLERLSSASGEWTLQFLFACDPASVRATLAALDGKSSLFVLPVLQDDRACFRVCWGKYASRERALAARDVPSYLRGIAAKPVPKQIADVL